MGDSNTAKLLTKQTLQELKERGFRFVLIKGYAVDRQVDYIQLNHFTLVPVVELPQDPAEKEIFEPIDSDILEEWVSDPENIRAYVEIDPKLYGGKK
ncbi:MAG: hypothetical protein JST68_26405 [Bacteroidetes bacterium]|nr:hypothetical protein [Bacteroidota bacterium]